MKLLYINYWGIKNALTEATVFPNLSILSPYFSEIILATVERKEEGKYPQIPKGVEHIPFASATKLPKFFGKIYDLIFFTGKLYSIIRKRKINILICRGSMAAIFGFLLNRLTGLPFYVESFEPHADYMADAETWSRRSIQYKFQKWIECQTVRYARCLMPVTYNYSNKLIQEGVSPERIVVMPCCVDIERFQFNQEDRFKIRKRLGIPDSAVVGIYVGKFGDLYLKEEAFVMFQKAFKVFGDRFFLIILSPQEKIEIGKNLSQVGIKTEKIFVDKVAHEVVPLYLSAADFAFSLIRPKVSSPYCSPVKNGEYWASGLPILITKGIGDDERIIHESGSGSIFDLSEESYENSLSVIRELLKEGRQLLSSRILVLAIQHRNFQIIRDGYKRLFEKRHINSSNS